MASTDNEKKYLGAIGVSVAVPDFDLKGKARIAAFRRVMREAHEKGIREGREILQDILSTPKYMDTGTLMESVSSKLFIKTTDIFSGSIHFIGEGKEYAYFVEHGRKGTREEPGNFAPPIAVMADWGERHGMSFEKAMAIRNKIKVYGTPARPFMDRAEKRIQANYKKIVDRAVNKFRKTLN